MANSVIRLSLLIPALLLAAQEGSAPPPPAAIHPVTDEYFGRKIVDPYRWMEDEKNPELQSWMKTQAAYTRTYLDRQPGYNTLLSRAREVATGDLQIHQVVRAHNRYVYAKLRPGENLTKLYVRDGVSSPERLLYDPAKESTDQKHVSLGDFQLSDDAHYASYIAMRGGGEYGDLRIVDLDTGRALPDVIPDTRWSGGTWAPDGKSLAYFHFQQTAPDAPAIERMQKVQVFLHRLGTPISDDKPVFGYGFDPHIPIAPTEVASVEFRKSSSYALGTVNSGVSPESDFYLARTSDLAQGTPLWRKIVSREDKVKAVELHGNDLYVLTFKDASHSKILRTSATHTDLAHAEVVVPESGAIIQSMGGARDGLYLNTLEGGPQHIYRLRYNAHDKEKLPLPANSSGDLVQPDQTQDGVLIRLNEWTEAPRIYYWDPQSRKLTDTQIQPPSSFEPEMSQIEATAVKVRSYDGTPVPLVILAKKGIPRNGANPLLLTGYGAYGYPSTSPGFGPLRLLWFDKGGIVAIAGVRGGGEFGEEWHLAGKIATKPNTWKDFIACAEYLVAQHYTSTAHLGIEGGSAGGVLIGNSITERPDLFGAAVMAVPMTDTLRSETTANGIFNIAEFGSVKTEEGFRALLAMDAYHKVKPGTSYPAVLFIGGFNDPRVNPFFSAKMGARLQASNSNGRPILLDFYEDSGHGIGNSQEQWAKQNADMYTFLFAQLTK